MGSRFLKFRAQTDRQLHTHTARREGKGKEEYCVCAILVDTTLAKRSDTKTRPKTLPGRICG